MKGNIMNKNEKIYIAGHTGLVGSALVRALKSHGYTNIITKTRKELDLTNQQEVELFFRSELPAYVFLAAAKVGGINYNKLYPADFITENILIQTNVIKSAYDNNVKKLLFLGSACIYPKITKQPIKEEYLLTGPLEETNNGYAIAKIAGLTMCQKYTQQYGFKCINLMPTNLYGIEDRFNTEHGHVIPGLINKFITAKENGDDFVTCWGDGSPTREFLFSDDLADACIFLMNNYDSSDIINVGIDNEITMKELAEKIKTLTEF
ncbi:MAG: GDP-L-fucose synthase family protein [Nitrososphaerota archaeon]